MAATHPAVGALYGKKCSDGICLARCRADAVRSRKESACDLQATRAPATLQSAPVDISVRCMRVDSIEIGCRCGGSASPRSWTRDSCARSACLMSGGCVLPRILHQSALHSSTCFIRQCVIHWIVIHHEKSSLMSTHTSILAVAPRAANNAKIALASAQGHAQVAVELYTIPFRSISVRRLLSSRPALQMRPTSPRLPTRPC